MKHVDCREAYLLRKSRERDEGWRQKNKGYKTIKIILGKTPHLTESTHSAAIGYSAQNGPHHADQSLIHFFFKRLVCKSVSNITRATGDGVSILLLNGYAVSEVPFPLKDEVLQKLRVALIRK